MWGVNCRISPFCLTDPALPLGNDDDPASGSDHNCQQICEFLQYYFATPVQAEATQAGEPWGEALAMNTSVTTDALNDASTVLLEM